MPKGEGITRFEDFDVYKLSRDITKRIYIITARNVKKNDYPLTDQMRRAAVSVMSNIAEGYERSSRKEFAHFLNIAKGSNGELRSQLNIALDLHYIDERVHKELSNDLIRVSAMLNGFIKHLKQKPD